MDGLEEVLLDELLLKIPILSIAGWLIRDLVGCDLKAPSEMSTPGSDQSRGARKYTANTQFVR